MKTKISFVIVFAMLIALLTLQPVYAAQGLKADWYTFALSNDEMNALVEGSTNPEDLFSEGDLTNTTTAADAFSSDKPTLYKIAGSALDMGEDYTGDIQHFAIRFTGSLTPAESGEYTFKILSDNGFLLKLDGKVVVDYWETGWDVETKGAPIKLEKGKAYKLECDYFENWGDEYYNLTWSKDGGEFKNIPLALFSTTAPSGSTTAPAATTKAPAATTAAPVSTTVVPAATTAAPAVTSAAPATSEQAVMTPQVTNDTTQNSGGFPLVPVIIIAAILVIGSGVAAFYYIKKKS